MRTLCFTRHVLSIAAVMAMLAACRGSQAPIDAPLSPSAGLLAERAHPSSTYGVLYSFKGYPDDGAYPEAGLLNVNDTFYGTTQDGGRFPGGPPPRGCGTIFALTRSGAETVLYSFKCLQHSIPLSPSGLINVNGTLYGSTYYGGTAGFGTVFTITASGKESVLYSFKGYLDDGSGPAGELIFLNGELYGTTAAGGANGDGTVFAITTSGKETLLYSFKGDPDGKEPHGVINVSGVLYGTTAAGGAKGDGTVFAITTSGKETMLYSFKGYPDDGSGPRGGLINVNGTLYGTTCCGGANPGGTVFAITTSGKEKVLHSFTGTPDGSHPDAGLVDIDGTLYGVTYSGGSKQHGTVFGITTSGKESVLHDFAPGRRGGSHPFARLINVKGTLYGTAEGGGANLDGTVFSLTP